MKYIIVIILLSSLGCAAQDEDIQPLIIKDYSLNNGVWKINGGTPWFEVEGESVINIRLGTADEPSADLSNNSFSFIGDSLVLRYRKEFAHVDFVLRWDMGQELAKGYMKDPSGVWKNDIVFYKDNN